MTTETKQTKTLSITIPSIFFSSYSAAATKSTRARKQYFTDGKLININGTEFLCETALYEQLAMHSEHGYAAGFMANLAGGFAMRLIRSPKR